MTWGKKEGKKVERAVFAVKDFLRNLFHRRGRLSRSGYLWVWVFVLMTDMVLIRLSGTIMELLPRGILGASGFLVCLLWNIAMYFALLFAAMRRYHDSGKPGWLALVFDGVGRLCAMAGVAWLIFLFILLGIGGPGDDEELYRLLGGGLSVFAVGVIFCVIDIRFLLRESESGKNAYGEASPVKELNSGEI